MYGTGISKAAKPPVMLNPGPTPMLWNMGVTMSGKAAANIDRRKVLAAMADAAYWVKVSTR